MTRTRSLMVALALVCASCAWWTTLQADEDSSAPAQPQPKQIAQLTARLEKLEKRIAVLEGNEQLTRQANAEFVPTDPLRSPERIAPPPNNGGSILYPKGATESTRPAARVWLLKKTEQK